jgi:hypothetical protein
LRLSKTAYPGTPVARFANDNPPHHLRLRPDAKEITLTLTATRETGTVRPTSSPTFRFLGDLGMIVLRFFGGLVSVPLATILGAYVIGFVINLIWLGLSEVGLTDPWIGGLGADEGQILGANAGIILVLAGLAWFSFRRRAWMFLMGGITAAALGWYLAYEFSKAPI